MGWEPPDAEVSCPACGGRVKTTGVYPSIDSFPMPFETLRRSYEELSGVWEPGSRGLEDGFDRLVGAATSSEQIEDALNNDQVSRWLRQRIFHRSCMAFYRSFQLFCAFLVLDRRSFKTWAQVTGYYSRFFFLQAFVNLLQATWVYRSGKYALVFYDGGRVKYLDKDLLPSVMRKPGSHEQWWRLMEAVKHPADYPIENIDMVIGRLVFNPEKRNNENYSFQYMEGFPELDSFDAGARQMMNHFSPDPRRDRDITAIDRYFEGYNPEYVEPGDFYTDDGAVLWKYLAIYLNLLKAIGFQQRLIKTETIVAIGEVHVGRELPVIFQGIVQGVAQILDDGFDVNAFLQEREANEDRLSSFWPPS